MVTDFTPIYHSSNSKNKLHPSLYKFRFHMYSFKKYLLSALIASLKLQR